MKKWRVDLFLITILILFILIFFAKLFIPNTQIFITPDFGTSDLLHFYYPIKDLYSRSLKNFDIPLWSSAVGTGFPMHAEGQMGTFSIFNLLLFGFLPTPLAFNLVYVSSFLMIAFSTYVYAILLKFSRSIALLVATIFTFSGFYISQISHTSLMQTAAFLPLELVFVELFLQKKRLLFLLLFSLTLSQQIFTGLQQITFYSLLFVGPYILFRIFILKEKGGWKPLSLNIPLFLLAIIFGFILSAVQLLPSLELSNFSIRQGGLALKEIFAYPYTPKHLTTLFSPFLLGNPADGTYFQKATSPGIFWENTGYVGVLTLILAFFGVIGLVRKNRLVFFFFITLIISFFLVLGRDSPLYIVFTLPPFNLFRVPSRFLLISDLSLAILAGFGASFLLNLNLVKRWKHRHIIPILFTILIVTDLFFFFYNYHPVGEAKIWTGQTKTAQFLTKDKNLYRIYTVGSYIPWNEVFLKEGWKNQSLYLDFLEDLNADFNLLFDIQSANIHVTIPTRRFSLFQSAIEQGIKTHTDNRTFSINKKTKEFLSLQNVKYVLTPLTLVDSPGFKLIYGGSLQNSPYKIYENLDVYQRVILVPESETVKSIEELRTKIASEELNPKEKVILEKDIPHTKGNFSHQEVNIISYQDREVKIQSSADKDGFLVLSDSYYPGWKAYVDGKGREILAANVNQKAVFLEKGKHEVIFSYWPTSFKVGGIISLFSHLFLIIFILISKFKTFPKWER